MTTGIFGHDGNCTVVSFISNLSSRATFAWYCQLQGMTARFSLWTTEVQDEISAWAHQPQESKNLLLSQSMTVMMVIFHALYLSSSFLWLAQNFSCKKSRLSPSRQSWHLSIHISMFRSWYYSFQRKWHIFFKRILEKAMWNPRINHDRFLAIGASEREIPTGSTQIAHN